MLITILTLGLLAAAVLIEVFLSRRGQALIGKLTLKLWAFPWYVMLCGVWLASGVERPVIFSQVTLVLCVFGLLVLFLRYCVIAGWVGGLVFLVHLGVVFVLGETLVAISLAYLVYLGLALFFKLFHGVVIH